MNSAFPLFIIALFLIVPFISAIKGSHDFERQFLAAKISNVPQVIEGSDIAATEYPLAIKGSAELTVRMFPDRYEVYSYDDLKDTLPNQDNLNLDSILSFYKDSSDLAVDTDKRLQQVLENQLPVSVLGANNILVKEFGDRFEILIGQQIEETFDNSADLSIENVLDFYQNAV